MEKFKTQDDWIKLARWLQTNPSPRFQSELDNWVALSKENEAIFNVWRLTKLSSRTADSGAPGIDELWPNVKKEVGIKSQKSKGKSSRKSERSRKKQKFYQSAWFMGLGSMVGLGILLLFLSFMRTAIGFN